MRFALVLLLVALVATLPGSAAQAAKPSPTGDRPQPGPRTTHIVKADDQIASPQAGTHRAAASAAAMAPFLTRPYWNQHAVTSIFDHCSPNYVPDGLVCRYDGVMKYAGGFDETGPPSQAWLYYDGHDGWDYGLYYENVVASADGKVVYGIDALLPGMKFATLAQCPVFGTGGELHQNAPRPAGVADPYTLPQTVVPLPGSHAAEPGARAPGT